jgi:hypothetical protein
MRLPNMAGREDCDEYIKRELEHCLIKVCRISEVEAYKLKSESEVPYTLYGELGLGDFTFRRYWYYYVVEAKHCKGVPLALAEQIYTDPACKYDVRANGGDSSWTPRRCAVWFHKRKKKQVLKMSEREGFEKAAASNNETIKKIGKDGLSCFLFCEDSDLDKLANGFVNCYHIDTEVGLRVFSDCLRKHFKW